MNSKKRNFLISGILVLLAITFTILVKVVDVKPIGANHSEVGLATVNQFVFETIGVNMVWYDITYWLGLIPIFMAIAYALIGLIQVIKRRSLLKIDKEIVLLGLFYIVIVVLYAFFEKFIINYRPVLIDGALEASYPSTHTLITLCICGSSIIINKKLFNNKITKIINCLSIIILTTTVVGRLISGVHWFSDIVGGILISSGLLMTFYSLLSAIKKENKTV